MPETVHTRALRTVSDLMHRHFMALSPQESLPEAEQKMRMARVRSLPVLMGDRLLGLASHTDVVRGLIEAARAAAAGPPGPRRVGDLMVHPQASVSPEAPLDHAAARLCALGSGFLAVVEPAPGGDRILGVLTESDLLRAAWLRR